MTTAVIIAFFGALGCLARYYLSGWVYDLAGRAFPYGTLCVNIAGAFLIGFVMEFAIRHRWFPVALWGTPWHAILPMIALGLYYAGKVARLMREGMLSTLHADFIVTARAKGLSETAVLWKHAFRLAVLPVVSYLDRSWPTCSPAHSWWRIFSRSPASACSW